MDEDNRLMIKSIYNKEGENQIKEFIHAHKLALIFLDKDQHVTFDDIGSISEFEKWSRYHDAELHRDELPSKFRSSVSDAYRAKLNHSLLVRSTANANWTLALAVSCTIQFGGCKKDTPNCLVTPAVWNHAGRPYRPRKPILEGFWKFPEAQPVR